MNLSELKELFELISERNISEFELEEQGVKLRIKQGWQARQPEQGAEGNQAEPLIGTATGAVAAAAPGQSVPAAAAPDDGGTADDLTIVPSPMVGTFYRQSEPGAEPFAALGQHVEKGQTLCIIEAMKLMNEIESDLSGEVVEVFVDDGQSVQFGDKLFAIREG